MVKFSSNRVIILSALLIATQDARRLKKNKKPCNKKPVQEEEQEIYDAGREVEIVHEIQKISKKVKINHNKIKF